MAKPIAELSNDLAVLEGISTALRAISDDDLGETPEVATLMGAGELLIAAEEEAEQIRRILDRTRVLIATVRSSLLRDTHEEDK